MSVNNIPEYFLLFEETEGDVTIKVRFAKRQETKFLPVKPLHMNWKDVLRLFGGPEGMPFNKMTFDEWPFTVKKIEIEPGRGQVTLVILE